MKENTSNITLKVILIAAAACLIYGISAGVRGNYGIMLQSVVDNSGVNYASVSFIMAVGQLMVGVVQPLFGALALKKSNSYVLITGLILMIVSMALIPFCHSFWTLLITLGILLSGATGALAFGIIMGAVTPALGTRAAAMVSGLISASAGMGGIILSPAMQQLIDHVGLKGMMWVLCIPMAVLILVSIWIGRQEHAAVAELEDHPTFLATLKEAGRNRGFQFIALAFFTCGFHMAIIETHLYSQYVSYGFSDALVAVAFSIYGIAAMLGCVFTGYMDTKFPNHIVLAATYGSRVPIALATLFLPKSVALVFITAFLFGFTGNATVPPTSGVLTKLFGARKLGVLFGIAFLMHQIGAFFSAWLGGILLDLTGGYTVIWLIACCFSIGAATLAILIKEK